MSNESQQPHHGMTPLQDQTTLESLLNKDSPVYDMIVILFSAAWCVSCSKIDKEALLQIHPDIRFYYVDLDEGEGQEMLFYVGMSKIPGILAVNRGVPSAPIQTSDNEKIAAYVKKAFRL